MQDRYAGDIGDYVKLGLLRALLPGRRLHVCWFKTPDAGPTGDGRHVAYLSDAPRWRHLDPALFDHLGEMVASGRRSIADLEPTLAGPPILLFEQKAGEIVGPPATFHDHFLSDEQCRTVWFVGLHQSAVCGDMLFLDPDNGITPSPRASPKHVAVAEILFLQQSARTLVVYHHLTRRKGGHQAEMAYIANQIVSPHSFRALCAVRARRWSARAFFIVAPNLELWERAKLFCERWSACVEFCAFTDPPDELGLTPGADAYLRADAAESVVQMLRL